MRNLVFAVLTFISIGNVYAEPIYGRDILGMQQANYPVSDVPSVTKTGTALGNLDFTFSPDTRNLAFLLERVAPVFHRVHIINGTCIRNGNCGPYEIGYGYTKDSFNRAVRARTPKILNFVRERTGIYKRISEVYPGTKFAVSPELEHDHADGKAWRILADTVKEVWPEVQLVNSVDKGIRGERYRGAWLEKHGTTNIGDADIVSTDGEDITDANVEKLIRDARNAKVLYAWTRSDNLRTNSEKFVDPRKRKNAPTKDTIELASHIFDSRGAVPNLNAPECRKKIPFRSPWIWKPLSEDYIVNPPGDNRPNLPVVITQFDRKELQLVASNGAIVGRVALYGKYTAPGYYRHYSGYKTGSGSDGYQFEKNARAVSGSPYTWLKSGAQCAGPLITGRRNGAYR